MAVDIFSTRYMMTVLEESFPPSSFMLDKFFTQTQTSDQAIAEFDVITIPQKSSSPQSPKLPSKPVQAVGYKTKTTPRAYFAEKIPCEAWDMLHRLPGDNAYVEKSVLERASVRMALDLKYLRQRLYRKYELMAIEALTTGKLAVKGDGVNFEVDYEYDTDNLVTLAGNDVWTGTTAEIYSQLKDWAVEIQRRSGYNSDIVVLGKEAAKLFVKNAEIKEFLDNRRYQMGEVKPDRLPGGVSYIGSFPEFGDVYSYNWATTDDSDELVSAFPDYGCYIGCTQAVNWRLYGPVPSFSAPRYTSEYPDIVEQKDPEIHWTRLRSTFIPGLVQPKAGIFVTVGSEA